MAPTPAPARPTPTAPMPATARPVRPRRRRPAAGRRRSGSSRCPARKLTTRASARDARISVQRVGDGGRIIEAGSEVNWPKIPPSGSMLRPGFVKPNSRILPADFGDFGDLSVRMRPRVCAHTGSKRLFSRHSMARSLACAGAARRRCWSRSVNLCNNIELQAALNPAGEPRPRHPPRAAPSICMILSPGAKVQPKRSTLRHA